MAYVSHEYNPDKKSKKKWLTLLLLLLILLLIATGIYCMKKFQKGNPLIDDAIQDYTGSVKRTEEMAKAKTLIPGFKELYMNDGESVINVALSNPKDNPCYFKYIIIDKESNKELFATQLIPPGKVVNQATLPKIMHQGEYDLLIKIQCFALDDPKQGATRS